MVIIEKYNRNCMKLINIVTGIVGDNPTLDWFTRMFKIMKNENPSMMLERGSDKLWSYKDYIINRNELFFKNELEFNKPALTNDKKEWIHEFLFLLKNEYEDISDAEKSYIWDIIQIMLECVIQYKLFKD